MNFAINGGINLVSDARRIAAELPGFESKLQSRKEYYSALQHLVGRRPGFVRRIENAKAHTAAGLYDGYVNEDINPVTGYVERISYSGHNFLRVLYDEKNVPVGAYSLKTTSDGHLDAYVLAPGEKGEIMQVKPDGSSNIFISPGNFFDSFKKNNFRLIDKS